MYFWMLGGRLQTVSRARKMFQAPQAGHLLAYLQLHHACGLVHQGTPACRQLVSLHPALTLPSPTRAERVSAFALDSMSQER